MHRTLQRGFTLVELLAVIVIVGILLGIGIPAMTSLMKSSGLSAASRQVSSTISLARQHAITQRTTTYVVFPYSGTTGTPGTNLAPWYQSYAVVSLGSLTNYLTKWELLPLGTVFMDKNAAVGNPPCLDDLASPITLSFPHTNSTTMAKLACIAFKPTGAASDAGSFTLTEGHMDGVKPLPTSKSGSTLVNVVTVSVDNIVGRIRVSRP